ncbi:hypothetical protein MHLP_04265 [Candidatus Mycoplasma haematolamae str. Purdue]|uniref:Uncharacterized protein n=1 Tax=Mycoplasma haematolamae (strain Purdue) TaxID=1212765 RepID=I7BKM7_MYCHA|nr:hypothetical protein [Candidatus Mycoplasma haematolamae]AFO52433.1 hypothetical protein MHLP_04265 [Candidatus Mycoplasma haematolamae str. Purdue]
MKTEKIVAFQIDFFRLSNELTREELTETFQLLREISIYNQLFFFTNSPCDFTIKFIRDWELPLGYLIFNSGACVYSIAAQKKVAEVFLDSEIAKSILKASLINNLSFVIHTSSNKSFVQGLNYLNLSKYRGFDYQYKLVFAEYEKLNTWEEITFVINQYQIYSIEVLFFESQENLRREQISSFLGNLNSIHSNFRFCLEESTIHLFSKSNSKIKTVSQVLQVPKALVWKNLIYSSITYPDFKFAENAYFWLCNHRFSRSIDERGLTHKVIFSTEKALWVDWWRENDYIWRENYTQLDWIFKHIKRIDLGKSKKEEIGNCFDLDLKTGTLSTKILNERERLWEKKLPTQKTSDQLLTVFLWHEHIQELLRPKN